MAWDLPANPIVNTIATVAAWGQKVKDCLEYIKGLAGPVTIEDDVTVDNLITAGLVDGVDVANHHARHENGGADEPSVLGLSGLLADDQNPVVHGAAEHTDILRELFLPACGYTTGALVNTGHFSAHALADAADHHSYFNLKVPDDFVSLDGVRAVWKSIAAAGNMAWRMQAHYGASTEAYNTNADEPALGTTATGGALILNVQKAQNDLTLPGLALGDYVGIDFFREGTHANDTLGQLVHLLGLWFVYTANQ